MNKKLYQKRLAWIAVLSTVGFIIVAARLKEPNSITTVIRTNVSVSNYNYVSNRVPLKPLHFIKLPVGSIKPDGWVKKYLELQRDGLTGKLGEISAWLQKDNNAWFSGDGSGDHGWEEAPYWLKGYGNLAYILNDAAMIAETKQWIEKVLQSQQPNGYFGPKSYGNIMGRSGRKTLDLWPNMIMLWCLQSYYEYSNDARVLPFMSKYFKWQTTVPDSSLLKIYWENSRGGDNLYSIYWLYNRTGEDWLLPLAEKIHRNTANWRQPANLPNWHNVNVAQCFREPATWYMQSKDSADLRATYNDFWLIREKYGQVPGGMFGADENARKGYDDPRQAVETCGMVEQMASNEILTAITGDPFWANHCEEVAFNTYPAAFMPDFKALRYLTAPNMVVSDSKNHNPGIDNNGPFLMMNPFSSRCCQHNHAQGWPYYAEHLWMATPDNGLVAMLYNSSEVDAKVGNGSSVNLKQETHYPFDDEVKITVQSAGNISFPLYLRIPAWTNNAKVFINGKQVNHTHTPGTYTKVERTWSRGDVVRMVFPKQVKVTTWQKNKNSISVNYGPLTFSTKIKEDYRQMDSKASAIGDSKWQANADESRWPSYEIYPASAWNYGLAYDRNKAVAAQFSVVKKPWPQNDFPFSLQTVPLEIKTTGKKIPGWQIDQYGLCDTLPQSPVNVQTKVEPLTLVPMGAARLRITAFPVVK